MTSGDKTNRNKIYDYKPSIKICFPLKKTSRSMAKTMPNLIRSFLLRSIRVWRILIAFQQDVQTIEINRQPMGSND